MTSSTYTFDIFDTCTSTMDVAADYVRTFHPLSTHVILAGTQTIGRGKPGRDWESPPGNLYTTVIFPVKDSVEGLAFGKHSPFLVIVALGAAMRHLGVPNDALRYKWPNDLLWGGQKMGGVLIESLIESGRTYFLLGLGVNLMSTPTNVPAMCLKDQGHFIMPNDVLHTFMPYFFDYYAHYRHSGFAFIKELWMRHSFRLNEFMHFKGPNTEYKGVFKGITDEGALILHADSGHTSLLYSGDIVNHL